MRMRLTILPMAAAAALVLSLAACGVKGNLEPPPQKDKKGDTGLLMPHDGEAIAS